MNECWKTFPLAEMVVDIVNGCNVDTQENWRLVLHNYATKNKFVLNHFNIEKKINWISDYIMTYEHKQ